MTENNFNMNLGDRHLPEEHLLMYVDGELSAKDFARAKEHLETCWTCRHQLEKIEETISLFVEFRASVQLPLTESPPRNWTGFSSRLRAVRDEILGPRTGWLPALTFSALRFRWAVGAAAAIVIAGLLFQLLPTRRVSAAELLESAIANESEKVSVVEQPVIRKKLNIRSGETTAEVEVWRDVAGSRSKGKVDPASTGRDVVNDLSGILRQNGMDPNDPLSPASFQNWRSRISAPTDQITDSDPIVLTTEDPTPSAGEVVAASISFRAADLHPVAQRIVVRTEGGDREFTISEASFELVSLRELGPEFFADPAATTYVATARRASSPSLTPAEEQAAESPAANTVTEPAAATTELEVEVLAMLNNAGADLDEDISVRRESGVLVVRGLVETDERKRAILNSLQKVRNDPAVRIAVETVAEANARIKRQTSPPAAIDQIEVETGTIESELARQLGSEADARKFAGRTIERSGRALSHVYAMRRLARQFSADEIRTMQPAARSKWLAIIASHARGFRTANDSLTAELTQVAGGSGTSADAGVDVNSAEDVPRAVEALFAAASGNDRAVRSAMTAGSGSLSAVRSSQFWQSVRRAEAIAARIAALK